MASFLIEPSTIPAVCIFKWITGLPCMFCGLTHAFHAISTGQFRETFAYHPLGFLAYALVLFHFITALLRVIGWHFPRLFPRLSVFSMMITTFVLFTLVWITRLLLGWI